MQGNNKKCLGPTLPTNCQDGFLPLIAHPSPLQIVQRINNAFRRMDQIQHSEGGGDTHWFAPIVADGEAGEGSACNQIKTHDKPGDGPACASS